jgi:hypothetical protein
MARMCPMPPCESAEDISSDSRGTGAESPTSSERRRMKPTWGPLPWVRTMPQPRATRVATWRAVSMAF